MEAGKIEVPAGAVKGPWASAESEQADPLGGDAVS